MRFEEVLLALREGKKVRKSSWIKGEYIYKIDTDWFQYLRNQDNQDFVLTPGELLAEDWEIAKMKKVKLRDLTREQYEKWRRADCGGLKLNCDLCPLRYADCSDYSDEGDWLDHKELFSDKFLDQEIEIGVEEDD